MSEILFLSYSSKDKTVIDQICKAIESQRMMCWMAPRNIDPGAEWAEAIIDAIDGSKFMILLLTVNSNESVQVKREVERAASKNIPIIPLILGEFTLSKSMEYFLSSHHWHTLDAGDIENSLKEVIEKLKRNVRKEDATIADIAKVLSAKENKKVVPNTVLKSSSPSFTKISIYVVAFLIVGLSCFFIWDSQIKKVAPSEEEMIVLSAADLMSTDDNKFDSDVSSAINGPIKERKIETKAIEIELLVPDKIKDNLEMFTNTEIAYSKREQLKETTLRKFVNDEVPINIMIDNIIDEQISVSNFIDRLLSMQNVDIKVININKSENGKIKELFIEPNQ